LDSTGFTALTAVGGGLALVVGLERDRFPASLLRGTPFRSYKVPGLILAFLVGGSAAVATAAMLRSERLGARVSAIAGIVLVGWILGDVLLLRGPATRSWVELLYFAIGVLMVSLGRRAVPVTQGETPGAAQPPASADRSSSDDRKGS
jgi:hypothetical protein